MSGFTDRLKSTVDRYDELNRLMADPDVAADYSRLNELAQERSEIEELRASFGAMRKWNARSRKTVNSWRKTIRRCANWPSWKTRS